MNRAIAVCVLLAASAMAMSTRELASYVNSVQKDWVATPDSYIANLPRNLWLTRLGSKSFPVDNSQRHRPATNPLLMNDSFDSRENWPKCTTITEIRDQGHCGSCWAFSSSEMMSDRECITNKRNVRISAEDINSCSRSTFGMSCGGCNGGYPSCAMESWKRHGVVSVECSPYTVPKCGGDSGVPCPPDVYPTPKCQTTCNNTSKLDYKADKHFAEKAYHVSGEEDMMAEIAENGPCVASFDVYGDFKLYKGGVYYHTAGDYEGGHAVKAIGFGKEGDLKYWIVANSWSETWGEGGFFRIRRGNNECNFEDSCHTGIPELV